MSVLCAGRGYPFIYKLLYEIASAMMPLFPLSSATSFSYRQNEQPYTASETVGHRHAFVYDVLLTCEAAIRTIHFSAARLWKNAWRFGFAVCIRAALK